jgi:hypothetical protein
MKHTTKLFLVLASVMVLSGAVAGGAYAYWTAHGSGSGTASVGTPLNVTVGAASGTTSSLLVPGGSADLLVKLDNPNAYSVTIVGISQSGTVSVTGGTGCTAANAGVTVPTQAALNVSVATGTGVVVHIPNGASMSTSSASGCQGASFQIPVTVTVQR